MNYLIDVASRFAVRDIAGDVMTIEPQAVGSVLVNIEAADGRPGVEVELTQQEVTALIARLQYWQMQVEAQEQLDDMLQRHNRYKEQ